jgi:CelD/BcsL family acetyltransferase involved in cellulose biosynthesis
LREIVAEIIRADALSLADLMRWREFAAGAPATRSPFLSAAFTQAVARVRGGVRVAVLRRRGSVVGYFPFQYRSLWHAALGAGERVGGHMSDYMGIVGRSDLTLTPDELLRLTGLNSFDVSHLHPAQQAQGLTAEESTGGLALDFASGWEAYWAERRARSKDFVVNTQQKLRKIETALGSLVLDLDCRDPAELDRLIASKQGQYRATNVPDALAEPWTRALLHGLLQSRDPACTGLLSVLRAGDTWIAAHFGLRSGSLLHHWFPVYNPELSRFSPGRLLLVLMIQASHPQGITAYDFGAGDQDYKRDFATARYSLLRGEWRRPGLRSLIFRGSQSLAWRIEARFGKS